MAEAYAIVNMIERAQDGCNEILETVAPLDSELTRLSMGLVDGNSPADGRIVQMLAGLAQGLLAVRHGVDSLTSSDGTDNRVRRVMPSEWIRRTILQQQASNDQSLAYLREHDGKLRRLERCGVTSGSSDERTVIETLSRWALGVLAIESGERALIKRNET